MASKAGESEKVRSSVVYTRFIESAVVVRMWGVHKIGLYTACLKVVVIRHLSNFVDSNACPLVANGNPLAASRTMLETVATKLWCFSNGRVQRLNQA